MTQPVFTYDAQSVALIFAAVPLAGYADGEFMRITPNSEGFQLVMGVDGQGTRSKTGNGSGRLTTPLMQSSASNDACSAIHSLDLLAEGGAGIGVLSMIDTSGRSLLLAPEAWIVGWPEQGWDRTAGSREWVFEWADAEIFIGGN